MFSTKVVSIRDPRWHLLDWSHRTVISCRTVFLLSKGSRKHHQKQVHADVVNEFGDSLASFWFLGVSPKFVVLVKKKENIDDSSYRLIGIFCQIRHGKIT